MSPLNKVLLLRSISCDESHKGEMLSDRIFVTASVVGKGFWPFSAFIQSSKSLVTAVIPFNRGFWAFWSITSSVLISFLTELHISGLTRTTSRRVQLPGVGNLSSNSSLASFYSRPYWAVVLQAVTIQSLSSPHPVVACLPLWPYY